MPAIQENILHWVKGNKVQLEIPLQKVNFPSIAYDAEDYSPPQGSTIEVVLKNNYKSYTYTPTNVVGEVIFVTDNGELEEGSYGVIINITEPSGNKRRSKWNGLVYVHDSYEDDAFRFYNAPNWISGSLIDIKL